MQGLIPEARLAGVIFPGRVLTGGALASDAGAGGVRSRSQCPERLRAAAMGQGLACHKEENGNQNQPGFKPSFSHFPQIPGSRN
jgi:hypothetical protein